MARAKRRSTLARAKVKDSREYAAKPGPRSPKQVAFFSLVLLVLSALASSASRLYLSPVYGAVPTGKRHDWSTSLAACSGWIAGMMLRRYLPAGLTMNLSRILPTVAFMIPKAQQLLIGASEKMGPVYGPVVTELLTCGPLVACSFTLVAVLVPELLVYIAFPGCYFIFRSTENLMDIKLLGLMMYYPWIRRSSIEHINSFLYALAFPNKTALYSMMAALLFASWDPHVPLARNTAILNEILADNGYALLDRQESVTGYVSIVKTRNDDIKVLRCDHSILGGEWIQFDNEQFPNIREPVFAIFVMLEAVRLVEPEPQGPGQGQNALVVGMGTGTTPTALATHGINTTVIEIDPVVAELARKHFSLAPSVTPIIADALTYVADASHSSTHGQYSYIIHDVFTGGVEPAPLFTREFLQGLRALLADDGVIAINYVGDMVRPSTRLVARTIRAVFSSCRAYREDEEQKASHDQDEGGFTNLVFFCRKNAEAPLPRFRQPAERDYLDSPSRRAYLLPQYEVGSSSLYTRPDGMEGEADVLTWRNMGEVTKWDWDNAIGHWRIMRDVLPAAFWENW